MSYEAGNQSSCCALSDGGAGLLEMVGRYRLRRDDAALMRYLRRSWSVSELADLLGGGDAEIGATAARCLGLLCCSDAVWPLLAALKHDDASVVQAAEEALWYVWFSEGPAGFDGRVTLAAGLIANERYASAISILDEVIDDWPETAEAYHQRGLARFLSGDWLGAIADCKRAVGRNPCHFGALAHMGHAHLQMGQVGEALGCYRDALEIHPRLAGVESSVEALGGCEAASHFGHLERHTLRMPKQFDPCPDQLPA